MVFGIVNKSIILDTRGQALHANSVTRCSREPRSCIFLIQILAGKVHYLVKLYYILVLTVAKTLHFSWNLFIV